MVTDISWIKIPLKEFIPPKKFFRADPIDNQVGEVEYEDGGLSILQFDARQVTESIEEAPVNTYEQNDR